QIPLPGLHKVSLAMRGTGLVERRHGRLAGVVAIELLARSRETVTRLVELALAVLAQALANRAGWTVCPAGCRQRREQGHGRGHRLDRMTDSGRRSSERPGAGFGPLVLSFDQAGIGTH